MSGLPELVSIVIPTHNRSSAVLRAITALAGQTYPMDALEVVVVADGCRDDTVEHVHSVRTPFTLKIIEQPGRGAASARNAGAAAATGAILIFLDDDVLAGPELVAAHAVAHVRRANRVVIGYLHHEIDGPSGALQKGVRIWWSDLFRTLDQPGYRHTFRSLLSGNFSIRSSLFKTVGGFDEDLLCREDYELGARLIKIGAEFVTSRDATGVHRMRTDIASSLKRARLEGAGDVKIGMRHPDLLPTLQCYADMDSGRRSRTYRLASVHSRSGEFMLAHGEFLLTTMERFRSWSAWKRLYVMLRRYAYARGAIEEVSRPPQAGIRTGSRPVERAAHIHLDLADGIEAAERTLDLHRPTSAQLRVGSFPVGLIGPEPGAEPLRGVHLRAILASRFAHAMLIATSLAEASQPDGRKIKEGEQVFAHSAAGGIVDAG